MKRILMLFAVTIIFSGCSKDNLSSQEQERNQLDKLKKEIKDKIDNQVCNDSDDWVVLGLGSKPCGGPWEYIAYPVSLDKEGVNNLIEQYNKQEKDYNIKYKVMSDCMATLKPKGVICEDGKPKLVSGLKN